MGKWKSVYLHEIAEVFPSNVDKVISATELPVLLCNYMNVYYNRFIRKELLYSAGSVRPAEFKKFHLCRGDVIVTKDSETPNDIGIPAVVVDEMDNLVCGYHLAIIRADQLKNDGVFLMYALQAEKPVRYFNTMCNGLTRYSLTIGTLERQQIFMPEEISEQRKIAEVLSTVDEAIDKTRTLIEKYKNIKAGMMQDLLGAHSCECYEKKPLLGNIQIIIGGTPNTQNSSYWNGPIGWLSVEDFNNGHRYVKSAQKTITKTGLKNSSTKILKTGQLIISARGTVGVVAQMGCDLAFNQSCYGLNSIVYWSNDFLYYYLLSITDKIRSFAHGNVFGTITQDTFKNIFVPLFPKQKQDEIVEQLTAADERIQTERNYLDKLQNIKRGLMQDLLTNTVSVDALMCEGGLQNAGQTV